MMTKIYIAIQIISALVLVAGGLFLYWRKETVATHSCHSCSHCQLVEKGKDGKLIYTCGAIRGEQPKFYYDYAKPVYCGWWKKRKGWWYDHH